MRVVGTRAAGASRPGGLLLAAALLAAVALTSCTAALHGEVAKGRPVAGSGATSDVTNPVPAPSTTSPLPSPAVLSLPELRTNLDPANPVGVSVSDGRLTSVTLVNPAENLTVKSHLALDGSAWATTEQLGYGKTYQLTATALGTDGKTVTKRLTLSTVSPSNLTMAYLDTLGGDYLRNGATYGVGIVPVVHFDEPITDKAAAEKGLQVTVKTRGGHTLTGGVWDWLDDQTAHWRMENYLPSGAKVTVDAQMYGREVGPGLYGQADQSVSFTIGAKHVSIADDATHTVKVYFNDKLMRTMPTSMGRGGYTTGVGGEQIALWTMPGSYTVIAHENPAIMSSASFGLPANSPLGYPPEPVYWSSKITTDGIYLHELDTTVWAQGNTDVSHGCLNLNHDNAEWYYTTSYIGDVVIVKNVHTVAGQSAKPVQLWQGGDWSVPWSTWVKGSALS